MSDLQKAGRYEIIDRIGEGGFGVVYKGRDPFMKRLVAIKTCTSENDETRKRFLREAEIAGNIEHPNITVLYDFGYEDDTPYLVQEFLTGKDLDHRLGDRDPLTFREKLDVLLQMAQGLGFAHAQGITHRDIKPGNIRITDEARVKIMDFGIAKIASAESQLTQTGTTLGTPAYLSPEQLRGDPVDQRSDIYSFGVLAFELLCYRRMFEAETISALFFQILHQDAPRLSQRWPEVPPELDALVDRCVQKEPADRHQDFREIILILQPLIEGYDEDPSSLPAAEPKPPEQQVDQLSVAEGERQVAVTKARDQIENLLVSGELKQAARALVDARQTFGDPLPLRTLHERLVQMQTQQGTIEATAEDTPQTETAARKIDELLFAGDLGQAQEELMTARTAAGDTMSLLAAAQRVEAVAEQERAVTTLENARSQLEAGALDEAEELVNAARTLAPDTQGLESVAREVAEKKVSATVAIMVTEARQFLHRGDTTQALALIDEAAALGGTNNELEELRREASKPAEAAPDVGDGAPTVLTEVPPEDAPVLAELPDVGAEGATVLTGLPEAAEEATVLTQVPGAAEEATVLAPVPDLPRGAVPADVGAEAATQHVATASEEATQHVAAAAPPAPVAPPPPYQEPYSGTSSTSEGGLNPRIIGAAIAAVVLLAFLGWFFFGRNGDPAPAGANGTVTVLATPWAEIVELRGPEGEVIRLTPEQAFTPTVLQLPQGSYTATLRHPFSAPELQEVSFEVGGAPTTESFEFTPVDVEAYFEEMGMSQ